MRYFQATCTLAAGISLFGAKASATDVEMSMRGGFSQAASTFSYAATRLQGEKLYEPDYGMGNFGEAEILIGTSIPSLTYQFGAGYLRTSRGTDTATAFDNSCGVQNLLGLFQDCTDFARTDIATRMMNFDALLRYRPSVKSSSPTYIIGATYLTLRDTNHAQYLTNGFFSYDVHRKTSVDGFGVKGGIEDVYELMPGFGIRGTLLGSVVWSNRSFEVRDTQYFAGAPLQSAALAFNDNPTVFTWEARLAFYHDLSNVFGFPIAFEYGAKYQQVINATFTSNTAATATRGAGGYGSREDAFGVWSVFGGFDIALSR